MSAQLAVRSKGNGWKVVLRTANCLLRTVNSIFLAYKTTPRPESHDYVSAVN